MKIFLNPADGFIYIRIIFVLGVVTVAEVLIRWRWSELEMPLTVHRRSSVPAMGAQLQEYGINVPGGTRIIDAMQDCRTSEM